MTPKSANFKKATFNKTLFRTSSSQRNNITDNYGFKTWYTEEETGETVPCYGWIKALLMHALYPGSPYGVVLGWYIGVVLGSYFGLVLRWY